MVHTCIKNFVIKDRTNIFSHWIEKLTLNMCNLDQLCYLHWRQEMCIIHPQFMNCYLHVALKSSGAVTPAATACTIYFFILRSSREIQIATPKELTELNVKQTIYMCVCARTHACILTRSYIYFSKARNYVMQVFVRYAEVFRKFMIDFLY